MIIKAAIFDVDGTLLDSMGQWHTVAYRYMKSIGVQADEHIGNELFALTVNQAASYIIEEYNLSRTIEEVVEGMNKIVKDFYENEVVPKPGAKELLEAFKKRNIPMVVGTSTDRHCIEAGLNRLGLMDYFDRIFTCSEVGKAKSEPDLFLQAMAFMGSKPEETVVFEDGLYSIKTADSLGLITVGVFDEVSRADQNEIKKIVDFYISDEMSLKEFNRTWER